MRGVTEVGCLLYNLATICYTVAGNLVLLSAATSNAHCEICEELFLRIRFWGVRGTIPTPGPETVKYGGNTACLDIVTSDQQVIIIDAGTGIRRLGQVLRQEYPGKMTGSILLSHTHWDHIQGLPFFKPLESRRNRFVVVGQRRINKRLEEILARQFLEPYLPFAYQSLRANLLVEELESGESITIGSNTTIKVTDLNHPGGCLGFRVEDNGVVLAYCSDTGHGVNGFDSNVLELVRDADLLIHDAFFPDMEQSRTYAEWGHSCWLEATRLAKKANVDTLGLFHYAPDMSDQELETIRERARPVFSRTILTREGMTLDLPLGRNLPE